MQTDIPTYSSKDSAETDRIKAEAELIREQTRSLRIQNDEMESRLRRENSGLVAPR